MYDLGEDGEATTFIYALQVNERTVAYRDMRLHAVKP